MDAAALAAKWREVVESPHLREAPELCIEVVSPSNTADALADKTSLYLDAGAVEAWVVREDGTVELYGPEGRRTQSAFGVVVEPLRFDP